MEGIPPIASRFHGYQVRPDGYFRIHVGYGKRPPADCHAKKLLPSEPTKELQDLLKLVRMQRAGMIGLDDDLYHLLQC
jgi:hypothetical protein